MSRKEMYLPEYEHDACGIGFIANIRKQRSHQLVSDAIHMLENMEHRGGCGAEPETGDGAGIMIELPQELFESDFGRVGKKLPNNSRINPQKLLKTIIGFKIF